MFTFLLLVVTIYIHPANCELGHLWNELENSLIGDTDNLITLQKIFYPPNSVPKNTVLIKFGLTLNNITDSIWCYDCPFDCVIYNDTPMSCQLHGELSLSSDSNSNTYARLKNYINSYVLHFMTYIEYSTLVLLEALTFSQLNNAYLGHSYQIHFHNVEINDFNTSCASVIDALSSILSWVSMFNLCRKPVSQTGSVTL